ncbi:MAG TPA: hypothetical protein VIL47_07745 [Candidatus Bipolaricaulota bacterium]
MNTTLVRYSSQVSLNTKMSVSDAPDLDADIDLIERQIQRYQVGFEAELDRIQGVWADKPEVDKILKEIRKGWQAWGEALF